MMEERKPYPLGTAEKYHLTLRTCFREDIRKLEEKYTSLHLIAREELEKADTPEGKKAWLRQAVEADRACRLIQRVDSLRKDVFTTVDDFCREQESEPQ